MKSFLGILLLFLFISHHGHAQTEAVLRPTDKLILSISGVPEEDIQAIRGHYTINDSGYINLYLIGKIKVAGKKPSEIANLIQTTYVAQEIFKWPTVNITLDSEGTMRYVTVDGKVRQPRQVAYSNNMKLMEAIAASSGFNEFSKRRVEIIRNDQVIELDLRSIAKNPENNINLLPNDIITVK